MSLKVEAELEVEPGTPEIEMNPNEITQVFVNLVNNAAQAIAATGRPGRVRVTARPWLDGVAVSIADDGPGIPEELAPRVFEPFFTTKPEGEGTGLGLSICQGIVKEHGGRITLDPGPKVGATFTVELPRGTRAPRLTPPPATLTVPRALRLLVVDDELPILHYMRATLESWGHTVEIASDGSEALERALAQPFDAIICDLRMPRLGGREMYQQLAQRHPAVAERIIFATGDTVRGDTLRFLESLGRPFLHKPFTLAELRIVLAGVGWHSADAVVAVSEGVKRVLTGNGLPAARITVVPDGIDPGEIRQSATRPLDIRARLRLPPGTPLAVNVAALVDHKDHRTLLGAARAARAQAPDLHWAIAGDGELQRSLEAEIERQELGDRVHLLGYVEEADALIREGDVFVMSSKEEGMGSVVLHALALEKPVVATAAGGLPEVVPAEWLVPVGDAAALGARVIQALQHVSRVPFPERFTARAMA